MSEEGIGRRACHACRAMKVKCDQSIPECRRCSGAGRACPGYESRPDLRFRSMNERAEAKALRPRSKKALKRSPLPAASSSSSARKTRESSSSSSSMSSLVVYQPMGSPMSPNWEERAICHFFSQFTVSGDVFEAEGGYLGFLPEFVQEYPDTPHVHEAVKAVSLAVYNQFSSADLNVPAALAYGRALSMINVSLGVTSEATSDQVLLSLLLMSEYEIMTGTKPSGLLWETHGRGMALILQLRGPAQFNTVRGRSLFRIVFHFLQTMDLFRFHEPEFAIQDFPDATFPEPRMARVTRLAKRVCAIRAAAMHSLATFPEQADSTPRLITDVQNMLSLDRELQDWSDWAPGSRRYQAIHPPSPEPYSSREISALPTFIFGSIRQAAAWCFYWCIRIQLLKMLWRSLVAIDQARICLPLSTSAAAVCATMHHLASHVRASSSYLLLETDSQGKATTVSGKGVGGLFLMWFLAGSGILPQLEIEQQQWIEAKLTHIGHVVGIAQAHILRDHLRNWWRQETPSWMTERIKSVEQVAVE